MKGTVSAIGADAAAVVGQLAHAFGVEVDPKINVVSNARIASAAR
ncbi:MAG TPA: hypothetical protein VGH94_07030 [Acidimicrobiales bacterium]